MISSDTPRRSRRSVTDGAGRKPPIIRLVGPTPLCRCRKDGGGGKLPLDSWQANDCVPKARSRGTFYRCGDATGLSIACGIDNLGPAHRTAMIEMKNPVRACFRLWAVKRKSPRSMTLPQVTAGGCTGRRLPRSALSIQGNRKNRLQGYTVSQFFDARTDHVLNTTSRCAENDRFLAT